MKRGFSLIELIVVMAITAVLLAVALPNFLSARERARDAKRKEEMLQLKNALRLYNNDFHLYPASGNCAKSPGPGTNVNFILGCGANHATCCPCDSTVDFGVGIVGATCQTVYMKRLPSELGSRIYYYQAASGDDFCLKVALENAADGDIATSQSRCSVSCGGNCTGANDYCVCAD